MKAWQLLVILLFIVLIGAIVFLLVRPPQVVTVSPETAPSGNAASSSIPTTTLPQQGNTTSGGGGPSVVTTSGQPCPTQDFSLQQGIGSCTFAGGKTLICEGDLDDSLGTKHDSVATTGQVIILEQSGTIDGTTNGGSCHYSPPWTVEMSINSVKGGCGGGCSSVLVYRNGRLERTV